jgi:peptidoglycan/LPS O-acetylase OafA/YrhL
MFFRIQSLFLSIAAGLNISMFFTNLIKFTDGLSISFWEYTPTRIFILVTSVLSIVAVSSFKNRLFQMRICNLSTLISLGFQIYLAVLFFRREPEMIFTVNAVFPIVAAILTFIGMRYVARDEAMVMAASRLRRSRRR